MTLDEHLTKQKNHRVYSFRLLITIVTLIPILFGAFFKIMHWPGANLMIVSGIGFFVPYAISGFLRLKGSSSTNNFFVVLSTIILILMIVGPNYEMRFPFNTEANSLFWNGFFVFFFLHEIYLQLKYKVSIFTPQNLFTKKEER